MKKGFTLAEVLITLGIIGVVSAMTIPTLIHKYKNDEYIAGMKKIYATLAQATLSAKEQVGLENLGNTHPDRIIEQLDCVSSNGPNAPTYPPGFGSGSILSKCTLANGMQLVVSNIGPAGSNMLGDFYGQAIADTNGGKSPNEYGRDIWLFLITNDGRIIPSGAEVRNSDTGQIMNYDSLANSYKMCEPDRTDVTWSKYGCGGRLLKNNWVMDW
jgi:prepilin-type N-terminal cleavage/methylation domain-containing protein